VKLTRIATAGLIAGVTLVGSAWAGIGMGPIGDEPQLPVDMSIGSEDAADAGGARTSADNGANAPAGPASPKGTVVGAAKVSMYPRPADYGGTWERDPEKCKKMDETILEQLATNTEEEVDHIAMAGSPWPENPNCIYMGGFGLGPANPAVEFERDPGLWVRSVAISDGQDTLILTVIDAEGYLWDYKSKCERCGAKQLAEDLGEDLDIDPSSFVIAATHSHAAPDLVGGWGFVPDWYMAQVTDAIKTSIRSAVEHMQPAKLEVGEVLARGQNSERRDTYRSAEEQQLTWLRATNRDTDAVIATVGAYAAHPTTKGTNEGTASSDWVGVFERGLEERFGGIGLHFMTGLGNMSTSGGTQMGAVLAGLVPAKGITLTDTNIRIKRDLWNQPSTNVPLTVLGYPGFFDREFLATPSSIQTGKSPDTAPCLSASAFTVELSATAVRIGDQFALTAAPGEVFANLTNTIKDKSGAVVTMPLAQANDALGYMPQSFEISPIGQQGLGFVAGGVLIVNYEDSYAIDRCTGDKVLESSITMLDELRAAR
jgi:hypothetical protein